MASSPHVPHSRRTFLQHTGAGFGGLALAGLLQQDRLLAAGADLRTRSPHFPPRAKAVIQLFQNGGPSQMDLFDPKPVLDKHAGQPHPDKIDTFQLNNKNILLGTPFKFHRHGQCGMELSEVLPYLGGVADDLCLIRSMHTVHNNHVEAIHMMQSCREPPGFPAQGSWITYALGSENQNLPGYIVLRDPSGYSTSGKLVWDSGWLPATYEGTEFSAAGDAVHHLNPPPNVTPQTRRRSLDLLRRLNAEQLRQNQRRNELEVRIQNYELAARMQLEATQVLDMSGETAATRRLYGLDHKITENYGKRCLLARRLVEAGVRFVQVFPPMPNYQPWDTHDATETQLREICPNTDQPGAALITDLKQRGLLDDVIVLWTGEFGRLPITENASGRDHNRHAFSLFLAGGGFKGGYVHGATDPFGYAATEDRVSVPDLHATILHQLGLNHSELAFQHNGRSESLTDHLVTGAEVVPQLLT